MFLFMSKSKTASKGNRVKKVSSKKNPRKTDARKNMSSVEEVEVLTISSQSLMTFFGIVVAGVMISIAIYFGLRGHNSTANVVTNGDNNENIVADDQSGEDTSASTTLDDDAIKGDLSTAKVAIVEFSDFECPYCKRFVKDAYVSIMKNFVNSGKVVYVFRDYPLPFHNPAANDEAMMAECVHHIAGDKAYFAFHDKIFANTGSNGSGIDRHDNISKLLDLAKEVGADRNKVKECFDKSEYKDEIAKDMADASDAGISGTPSFIVGKLDRMEMLSVRFW